MGAATGEPTSMIPDKNILSRYHPWIFGALLATLSLPYYAAVGNPFTADDWLFLYRFRDASPGDVFSPRVIWFWRPLQNALFAGLYRAAGLNPVPYNLAGLGFYFLGAALWYRLFLRLFAMAEAGISGTVPSGRPARGPSPKSRLPKHIALALLASFILMVNWQYCDSVFWASNFGTLLGWVGMAWVLLAVLPGNSPPARFGAIPRQAWAAAGLAFALLAKESAVNIPFLAAGVWVYARRAELKAAPRRTLREGVRELWPLFALLAAYLAFHHWCVVDIERISKTGYRFVSPLTAARQYLMALNHAILFFDYAPPPFPVRLNLWLHAIETKWLFLPLLAWGWALWRRDGLLILALALASAALVPTVFLETFHASRFYLAPAAALALGWAAAARRVFAAVERWPAGWARVARIALAVLLAAAAARSLWQLDALISYNSAMNRRVGQYQEAIVAAGRAGKLPADACLVFDGLEGYPPNGFGLREMTKMLLGSDRAEGFRNGSVLVDEYVKMINASYPNKFRIWQDGEGRVQFEPLGNVQLKRTDK